MAYETTVYDSLFRSIGFLQATVGNEIDVAYPTTTTETYTFKNGGTTYFVLTVTYTDATKVNIDSVIRSS